MVVRRQIPTEALLEIHLNPRGALQLADALLRPGRADLHAISKADIHSNRGYAGRVPEYRATRQTGAESGQIYPHITLT